MMKKVHLIMPMAGEGKRFKEAGIDTPKPLIEFNGKHLFEHALEIADKSKLDISSATFIVREEHVKEFGIDKEIRKAVPDAIIIAVTETTRGAAETAFIAVKNLMLSAQADWSDGLLVMDCDVLVNAPDLTNKINSNRSDGILLAFNSDDPRYSYAKVEGNAVTETAEKKVVSSNAITSPYYIKKIEDFADAFLAMDRDKDAASNEMYMSNIYNYLIKAGKKVTIVPVESIVPLGTPEELKAAQL